MFKITHDNHFKNSHIFIGGKITDATQPHCSAFRHITLDESLLIRLVKKRLTRINKSQFLNWLRTHTKLPNHPLPKPTNHPKKSFKTAWDLCLRLLINNPVAAGLEVCRKFSRELLCPSKRADQLTCVILLC